MERLDRCLANPPWLNLFPKTTVENLTRTHSNHCPLILDTNTQPNHSSSRKPFRIEPLWLSHPSFEGLIHTYWPSSNLNFSDTIITLQTAINLWNRNTYGNIFSQKRRILARLRGIQHCAPNPQNSFLSSLELHLQNELNTILIRERQFWATKSHITWLKHGDANTSFFHTTTIKCRRSNSILSLRDKVGNWISSPNLINHHILDYFLSCYTTEHPSSSLFSYLPV